MQRGVEIVCAGDLLLMQLGYNCKCAYWEAVHFHEQLKINIGQMSSSSLSSFLYLKQYNILYHTVNRDRVHCYCCITVDNRLCVWVCEIKLISPVSSRVC